MPSNMLLGSEVIIMSVDDARRLVQAFPVARTDLERLQRLGILDLLEDLRSTVRRYDHCKTDEDGDA